MSNQFMKGTKGLRHPPTTEEEGATFTLVILKRDERHLAFATDLPRERALWNISTLPEEHRKRWGIEAGYNGVEQFRARTTSGNHSLRMLLLCAHTV